MIDINTLFSQALAAAVAEATKPLTARVEELEARVTDVVGQLARALLAADTGHAAASQAALEQRLAALEAQPATAVAGVITPEMIVNSMNNAEWLWDKVNGYIENGLDSRIEQAIEDHCSTYDHDEYDEVYNEWGSESPDDFVKDDDFSDRMRECVNDALNNATLSISL